MQLKGIVCQVDMILFRDSHGRRNRLVYLLHDLSGLISASRDNLIENSL